MDSDDTSSNNNSSSDDLDLMNLAKAAVVLRKIKALVPMQPPVVLTGAVNRGHVGGLDMIWLSSPDLGRYYLADSGYMEQQGYMTPFRDTRYHKKHFKGVDVATLDRYEKFNYIHSKLRNIIERRFGHLKEWWQILKGVPFFKREKQAWVIISCFAMDNYLWLRKYGDGSTYDLSDWVGMNAGTETEVLRELVSAAVWAVP